MALARTIARRSLLQHRGRTLFSILGIALGIATGVGVVTLDHSTVRGLSERRELAGAPDLEVRPSGTIADSSEALRALAGVSEVSAFFQNDAVVRPLVPRPERNAPARSGPPGRVRLYGLEAGAFEALGVHRVAEGKTIDPEDPTRQVLVGQGLAEELELALGDRISISRPERDARKECVDGELRELDQPVEDQPPVLDFVVVGILAREKLGWRSRGMVLIVDYEWGKVLYQGTHIESRYWVKRDPKVDIERLQTSLGQTYSYSLNKSVITGQVADERAFRTGVRMAGLLALVLGLYVIFHTLSMSLAERMGEVATLHALGSTRAQIARIFLSEATILAGSGAVLGLGGGILLAFGLLRAGVTTLGTGKQISAFAIPWEAIVPISALGFGIAMVGSIYPLARLSGASTVAALRGEEAARTHGGARGFHLLSALLLAGVLPGIYFVLVPVVGEMTAPLVSVLVAVGGFLALLVFLPLVLPVIVTRVCAALTRPFTRLWPFSGRFAMRTMGNNPARIAVSASAIALVSAGLVGLKGMTASLRGEVEVWGREAVSSKVWVRGLPSVPLDELAAHLEGFPGIIGLENGSARTYGSFLLLAADPDQLAGYGPCADDPTLIRKLERDHGIILSRRLAEDRGFAIGNPIPIAKADGTIQEFEVIAISDAYGYFPHPDERIYGVVGADYIERFFCVDANVATEVAVRTEGPADPDLVEAAMRDYLAAWDTRREDGGRLSAARVQYESGADLLAHHVMDIDRDFVLFDILVGLTAALAALGLLNGQLLAALERAKEIGVLKALGVSRRQVAGMVLLESLVVGSLGGGIGVALGAAGTPFVIDALQDLSGLALPHHGAGAWLAVAPLGAVVLAMIAALYPIWRMNRVDAVRAVRTG